MLAFTVVCLYFIHAMNDYHSQSEWKYIPRWVTANFRAAFRDHPIVVITGARQVGKSTFLQNANPASGLPYLTLDDLDVLAQAQRDPASLLAGKSRLIIDEIQKAPQLLSEVKRLVDRSNRQARIVLSGSANLLLMERVIETLAGRAVFTTLDSMTVRESRNQAASKILDKLFDATWPAERTCKNPFPAAQSLILRGLVPPVLQFSARNAVIQWWEGYVSTFLERDLRAISRIESLPDFRRLMTALALRSGQILNQTEVSRDIGIPQPTLYRYINMLELMCLLYRVPVYATNQTIRLIKSPKMYWFDSGLASYLSGHFDEKSVRESREWGGLFETFVYHHLRVWSSLQIPKLRLHYWRTSTGKEVDFVVERGQQLMAIEVKAGTQVNYQDTVNLKLFIDQNPAQTVAAVIIYDGLEIKRMAEKIITIPWHVIF